jgi:tryptophanyl-tRNA synthetase
MPATPAIKPRLLTGDRPTGALHLGHLVGSLRQRVAMQDDYECFNIVADLHTLTTRPRAEQIRELPQAARNMVLDLLSVGIDPERTVIYLQSGVPAVYDLAILLQMLVPTARLRKLDSVREMAEVAGQADAMTLGLLAYPVLQAADILMAQAEVIPVGGDNVAHVEIARELAARFNELYGALFSLPEARVSRTPTLPGIAPGDDASVKMSKSRGNGILLRDDTSAVQAKLGVLSGARLRAFVDAFIEEESARAELLESLDAGKMSDEAIRGRVEEAIETALTPIRARRAELAQERGRVEEILVDGTIRAREVAYTTLGRVRELMGLEGLWQGLVAATEARAEARKKPY